MKEKEAKIKYHITIMNGELERLKLYWNPARLIFASTSKATAGASK
jgi:hypothetical protein